MGQYSIRNEMAVRDALEGACARKEVLILVTPFLHFESSFVGLERDQFHAQLTMSPEEALYGLHAPELHIRFPHGTGFLEARTQFKGLGTWHDKPTLCLAIPPSMEDDDHRGAYRVDIQEDVPVSFQDGQGRPQTGHLVNLSATGARVLAEAPIIDLGLATGVATQLQFSLADGVELRSQALLRYVQANKMGAEFTPPLPPKLLEPLNRWIFRKREEDRERKAQFNRDSLESQDHSGRLKHILLVSGDRTVETALRPIKDLPPLVHCEPGIKSLRDALELQPALIFLHLASVSPEERLRVRMLADYLGGRWPFLILGTGIDNATLFELNRELRPAGAFLLADHNVAFFQRLVQGILRRLEEQEQR